MHTRSPLLFLAVAALGCAAAEPAYLGTWVPDQSQTDVTSVTVQYVPVDSVTYQVTMDGQTFTMRTDGVETETPWGGTMAVQSIDSVSWASQMRLDGNVIGTDTIWLSPDGTTLSMRGHRAGPDGADMVSEMQMRRTAGGPGLAGTWQASDMSGSMVGNLEITAAGDSGLQIHFASLQAACAPTWEGGDATATSPMFDGTWTCAIAEREDGGLTLTWKRSGEPRYISEYTVSANGDTLTEVSTAAEVNEPVTVVYTRSAEEH